MKEQGLSVSDIQQKLMSYCTHRDRSHKEVEQKLVEYGAIPEAKEQILLFLMQENFLNEERYAKSYARGKFYQNNWGKHKIVQGLTRQNISGRLLQTALQEIDEKDYLATLKKLIQTKKATLKGQKNVKLYRYLQQKGYDYSEFKDLL